jgi:hypothetical protein
MVSTTRQLKLIWAFSEKMDYREAPESCMHQTLEFCRQLWPHSIWNVLGSKPAVEFDDELTAQHIQLITRSYGTFNALCFRNYYSAEYSPAIAICHASQITEKNCSDSEFSDFAPEVTLQQPLLNEISDLQQDIQYADCDLLLEFVKDVVTELTAVHYAQRMAECGSPPPGSILIYSGIPFETLTLIGTLEQEGFRLR